MANRRILRRAMGVLVLLGVAALVLVVGATLRLIWLMKHPPRYTLASALSRGRPADPAALGLTFREQQFTMRDGVALPAWIVQGGNAEGPVLIVTHAWGESRYAVLPRVAPLAPLFAQLVLYDLRGHGEATQSGGGGGDGGICTAGDEEHLDLLEIVEQLLPPLPTGEGGSPKGLPGEGPPGAARRPIVLLGYSVGALVAIRAAARAGVEGNRPAIAAVIGQGAYRYRMEAVRRYWWQLRYPVYPTIWLVGAHWAWWHTPPGEFDTARHAARLSCPLLLLHGSADPIAPLAAARNIAAAAPQGSLVVFDGAGHLDLGERDPARYVQVVRDLAGSARPAAASEPR